jgi:hypothetical protein
VERSHMSASSNAATTGGGIFVSSLSIIYRSRNTRLAG